MFGEHTVYENLQLAAAGDKSPWATLFRPLSGEQKDRIDSVLDTIRLKDRVMARAGALSHGQKQWLEIGMLLMQGPQLLLVDEPVAGMTPQETERTAELLVSLAGEHSVVVVEHDMNFVRSIARKVTVLHEGSVLAEGHDGSRCRTIGASLRCIWASERDRHAIDPQSRAVLRRQPHAVGRHDGDPEGLRHVSHGPQRHGEDHAASLCDGAGERQVRARSCTTVRTSAALRPSSVRAWASAMCRRGARSLRS